MPYRLKYQVNVIYMEPGRGQNGTALQSKDTTLYLTDTAGGLAITQTFTAADVTTLTNAMAADIAAQLNVPTTNTRIQNWGANTFPATL